MTPFQQAITQALRSLQSLQQAAAPQGGTSTAAAWLRTVVQAQTVSNTCRICQQQQQNTIISIGFPRKMIQY